MVVNLDDVALKRFITTPFAETITGMFSDGKWFGGRSIFLRGNEIYQFLWDIDNALEGQPNAPLLQRCQSQGPHLLFGRVRRNRHAIPHLSVDLDDDFELS